MPPLSDAYSFGGGCSYGHGNAWSATSARGRLQHHRSEAVTRDGEGRPPSPSPQSPSPYPRPHTSSNTSPTTHDNSDNDELEYSMDDSHIPTSSTPPFPSSLSVLSHTSSNSRPLKPPNLSPNLRLTRPSGLSPSHISNTTSPTFFSSPTSLSGPPVAGSGTNVAKKVRKGKKHWSEATAEAVRHHPT